MTTAAVHIDSVLADPLALARQADFAIGYVGLDIPEDILAAPGLYAAHLPWVPGRKTPGADKWLEESFPGWARSMVEDWLAGEFDFLRFVVFSRGDDTSQRLYYYLCELRRRGIVAGPEPLIFDIAHIRKASSLEWTIAAVRQLAQELGLDEAALQAGIETANRRRAVLQELAANRNAPGHAYERIARSMLFAPLENLDLVLTPTTRELPGRLLLVGSSPPDDRLHRAAEAAHWSVVGEAYDRCLERLGPAIAAGPKSAAERIGRHIHGSEIGPRSFHDHAARLLELADRSRARAAVFWLVEEDEAIAWDLGGSRQALESAHLPLLVLSRRKWDCSDAPEAEITTFLGGLQP
jgi:hypothetical protein